MKNSSAVKDRGEKDEAMSETSAEVADLTTSQAARFLNVSRPYLSRLLDAGMLPFHHVGSHRKVRLRDVRAFKDRQDADSESALSELVAEAQELGMGY